MAFDPAAKERELLADADSWDTSTPQPARPGDIPVIDTAAWFQTGSDAELQRLAEQLYDACTRVGFYQLIGHGLDPDVVSGIRQAARDFHALPVGVKQQINIDLDWPIGGIGYLPVGERRLPRRAQGNRNEAFLVKSDAGMAYGDNKWLAEGELPGFRDAVEAYGDAISGLAVSLLPIYATALDMAQDFFDEAFIDPFWRLRLTHYPAEPEPVPHAYGIAPHVDTTFFTLLIQDGPGLTIYSAERDEWIIAEPIPDAVVVNSGELLKQWTNDVFLSTRHFANNTTGRPRYSIPLFFNANADWPMECIETCQGPDNPPRYPTISYRQSQAVVQGE